MIASSSALKDLLRPDLVPETRKKEISGPQQLIKTGRTRKFSERVEQCEGTEGGAVAVLQHNRKAALKTCDP